MSPFFYCLTVLSIPLEAGEVFTALKLSFKAPPDELGKQPVGSEGDGEFSRECRRQR